MPCIVQVKPAEWSSTLPPAFASWDEAVLLSAYRPYARAGDPSALFSLGFLFTIGMGDFPSPRVRNHTALGYLKHSALCDYHQALLMLADAYRSGELGVRVDKVRARCLRERFYDGQTDIAKGCGVSFGERGEIVNPNRTAEEAYRRR